MILFLDSLCSLVFYAKSVMCGFLYYGPSIQCNLSYLLCMQLFFFFWRGVKSMILGFVYFSSLRECVMRLLCSPKTLFVFMVYAAEPFYFLFFPSFLGWGRGVGGISVRNRAKTDAWIQVCYFSSNKEIVKWAERDFAIKLKQEGWIENHFELLCDWGKVIKLEGKPYMTA